MTEGEYRVGITFNPSGDSHVAALKQMAAAFIDAVLALPEGPAPHAEIARLKALACTHAEDAAMWAVKAATKPARRERGGLGL